MLLLHEPGCKKIDNNNNNTAIMVDISAEDRKVLDTLLNIYAGHVGEPSQLPASVIDMYIPKDGPREATCKTARKDFQGNLNMVGFLVGIVSKLIKQVDTLKSNASAAQPTSQPEFKKALEAECKKSAEAAVAKSFASVTAANSNGRPSQSGWQTVGARRSSTVASAMQQVRLVSTRPDDEPMVTTNSAGIAKAQWLAKSVGASTSAVMNAHVERTRAVGSTQGTPRAIVVDMSKAGADDLMQKVRLPEYQAFIKGWKVLKHLPPLEYRCRQALWVEFKTELEDAVTTQKKFRYLDAYTGIQIESGDKKRLSQEKLKALGVVN